MERSLPHIPLLNRLLGNAEPAVPPIQSPSPELDGIGDKALEHSLEAMRNLVNGLPPHDPWTANDHARVDFAVAGKSK